MRLTPCLYATFEAIQLASTTMTQCRSVNLYLLLQVHLYRLNLISFHLPFLPMITPDSQALTVWFWFHSVSGGKFLRIDLTLLCCIFVNEARTLRNQLGLPKLPSRHFEIYGTLLARLQWLCIRNMQSRRYLL